MTFGRQFSFLEAQQEQGPRAEVLIVPREERELVAWIERAAEILTNLDWRIYTLTVMPVSELKDGVMPKRPL